MKNTPVLFLLIVLIALIGCRENAELDWDVSEDRTTVSGILRCDCLAADIEMLVTDENTGQDYYTTFPIEADVRFERPVGILSNDLSINLELISVK